jgi:NAD(P)-dependent dehydrogenase (short-subunit alcohol dehydrogenase family)
VNNAAFFNKKGVLDMPFDEWNRQTGVILGGAFLFTKHVAHAMMGKGGVIINIVSTAGPPGEPGNIAYSTSKCGLLNFTRSAAMELVGHGIRVNSLTPTATDPTESFDRAARWGRHVKKPESLDRLMKPFRTASDEEAASLPTRYVCARGGLPSPSDGSSMITSNRPARRCCGRRRATGLGPEGRRDALDLPPRTGSWEVSAQRTEGS